MYVCKVFCPEAGPSLGMHYQGSAYLSLLDSLLSQWPYGNAFHCTQIQLLSEVVCQVLSSLSQWPYGNTFHSTHRHKSSANTTTKDPIPQIAPKLS